MSREPVEYQMTSHPFGATSSPFCANFALVKTVQMFSDQYDIFVQNAVQDNFYVDDCLVSFPSVEQAQSFVKQINELLSRGGFRLKKWVSNSEMVASVFPRMSGGLSTVDMPPGYSVTQRTLGLEWDTKSDVFKFRFDPVERPLTRRGIMSVVSSLFDPLGLISPTCLPAKQLLQKLCRAKLGWDQPLCESDVAAWEVWVNFMRRLGSVTVNRSLKKEGFDDESKTELHVFSDASESGYGAVAYARIVSQKRAPHCVLLFSKSRVAPIKHVTIPRLELAAAVLSVRVSELLKGSLPNLFCQTSFWTDSMIVLYYIKNCDRRYVTFVANRLSVIHQYSQVEQWLYVKSEWNPADWASRGITKEKDLKDWLDGPVFLRDRRQGFTMDCMEVPLEDVEFKGPPAQVNVTVTKTTHFSLLSYFSDWTKLVRIASWLRRYIDYIIVLYSRHKDRSINLGPLSVMEQETTKIKILKLVQREVYPEILEILRKDTKSVTHNDLRKLSPVMIDGLMRVGGRLGYSEFSASFKHPIILPNRHSVTESIIRHYHKEEGHCGTSQVLAAIRETYWIVKGIREVKRVIGRCVVCRRLNARIGQQMMAPLPPCRVKQGWYSFAFTGIDYFGPLIVRRGRSIEKRYGCVFTCLQTRAVHLEVAHDLSTDSFIMVLMRFMGRRGKPLEIYSDNGSNFVGAVSELRQFIRQWDLHKIGAQLTSRQIQWHFNPPSSSHRGGVWERIIRSIRRLLLVISNERVLQEETLITYMVEVERILNNRPLVPVTSDVNDRLCLTPNNLLLLRDCEGIAIEGSLQDKYGRRWRQVNYLADVFWRRWRKEYLPTLQCRQKWLMKHRNFREGDVVIVSTDVVARGLWPLGIVQRCEKDKDNLVRTVTVKTKDGIIRRDIRKVCLLEGAD
ncbi:Gag-Pol polyprotein [Schistosoma japonicum]|uniref:Gag-Pol polyprotein n=1 Tax=Schistosoma japonicum TaxID=6182 RepID=A0A4Z2CQC5_SCHJA|nr:Gag-Pol polyprotein [Schistosoma japonicum]